MAAYGSSRPSVAEGQAVFERGSQERLKYGKVTEFTKTNGQESNALGVAGYLMSYDAVLECTDPAGCCLVNGAKAVPVSACRIETLKSMQILKAGAKYRTTGTIMFQKSEKGWLGALLD